jgi:hypothetical protein
MNDRTTGACVGAVRRWRYVDAIGKMRREAEERRRHARHGAVFALDGAHVAAAHRCARTCEPLLGAICRSWATTLISSPSRRQRRRMDSQVFI